MKVACTVWRRGKKGDDIKFLPIPIRKMQKITYEIGNEINKKISSNELIVFSICGDIINKGEKVGFEDTKEFLKKLLRIINTETIQFVICPGNHDIVTEGQIRSFKELDKFIFSITNSSSIKFEGNSVNLKRINDIDFIMINSVYHLDHKYGMIDLQSLNKILEENKGKNKIIIVHHHLIPVRQGEYSTVVNSYEFLRKLEGESILAILHGHQHMKMKMVIGENLCKIIGVGSILTDIETNYNNQFNMINVNNGKIEKVIEYKYSMEEIGNDGAFGGFIEKEIF